MYSVWNSKFHWYLDWFLHHTKPLKYQGLSFCYYLCNISGNIIRYYFFYFVMILIYLNWSRTLGIKYIACTINNPCVDYFGNMYHASRDVSTTINNMSPNIDNMSPTIDNVSITDNMSTTTTNNMTPTTDNMSPTTDNVRTTTTDNMSPTTDNVRTTTT